MREILHIFKYTHLHKFFLKSCAVKLLVFSPHPCFRECKYILLCFISLSWQVCVCLLHNERVQNTTPAVLVYESDNIIWRKLLQEMSHELTSRGYRDKGEGLASLSKERENYAWIPRFNRHLVIFFYKQDKTFPRWLLIWTDFLVHLNLDLLFTICHWYDLFSYVGSYFPESEQTVSRSDFLPVSVKWWNVHRTIVYLCTSLTYSSKHRSCVLYLLYYISFHCNIYIRIQHYTTRKITPPFNLQF